MPLDDISQRTRSRLLNRIATLHATDGHPPTDYWTSLVMTGDTIAAGAPNHNTTGAAYVFVRPPSGWADMTQTGELTLVNQQSAIGLGTAIATSGSDVMVGAPAAMVGSNVGQGEAFLYSRPPTGWSENATPNLTITAWDGVANDALGNGVAISGETVVVGAPFHTFNSTNNQGVAYVLSH